ncbi:MAG: response regulator [Proteobacteria bacterium]|nr:response regulator [Pseudomonadota bacterium]MBU1686937.1 response regulator [Pseudomonadota bacterium]
MDKIPLVAQSPERFARMDQHKSDALRKRAEAILSSRSASLIGQSNDQLREILHDLQTHQIELELQNEELRLTQEQLTRSRDQYIELYDFAPVGYLMVNHTLMIEAANLTLADLLGVERSSLLGQPFSRFICNEDQDIFYKHFRKLTNSENRLGCELRLSHRNGEPFWAKLECAPDFTNDQNGPRIRIAVTDISDSKQLAIEILKAHKNEATGLLAGGIAHDFNNLLTIIMGNIELAREDILLGLPATNSLQNAWNASLNAAELTKKFLTFSTGGMFCKKQRVELKELLDTSANLSLAGTNVTVEWSLPDDLWATDLDAEQMSQALVNVVTNAREAMPNGGIIQISAENVTLSPEQYHLFSDNPETQFIKLSISDQGVGISENNLPKVFDPYYSTKTKGVRKGMGMGLSIAQAIIKQHGGFIDIISHLNIGSTVSIYLPASAKPQVSENTPQPETVQFNKKILLMDDEEMLRLMAHRMLKRLGCEVAEAGSGEEAVQLFSEAQQAGAPFGAVILDLTIKGGMGGEEVLKHLRTIDPHIRAIVTSGYTTAPAILHYQEYGFYDALQKPFVLSDIEQIIGRLSGARKEQ